MELEVIDIIDRIHIASQFLQYQRSWHGLAGPYDHAVRRSSCGAGKHDTDAQNSIVCISIEYGSSNSCQYDTLADPVWKRLSATCKC